RPWCAASSRKAEAGKRQGVLRAAAPPGGVDATLPARLAEIAGEIVEEKLALLRLRHGHVLVLDHPVDRLVPAGPAHPLLSHQRHRVAARAPGDDLVAAGPRRKLVALSAHD